MGQTRRKKYGGMETTDVRRLPELERENSRLKRIVAERDLEIDDEGARLKKLVGVAARRVGAGFLMARGISVRRLRISSILAVRVFVINHLRTKTNILQNVCENSPRRPETGLQNGMGTAKNS